MSFLSDLCVGIITGYLALTNSLAGGIMALFPEEPLVEVAESSVATTTPATESFLTELPSRLSSIPRILHDSAAFQQAAVSGATDQTEHTTTDPATALVNIYCTFLTDEYIKTTTGTGFFIDADGVIMTNAHVAQYLLLAATDEYGDATCTIRTGNPASPQYQAQLLYIPPAWIQENAAVLNDAIPMGTGERDYALLYVTDTVDDSPLPAVFPALPYSDALLATSVRGAEVTAAGYPADALLRGSSTTDLIPRVADTNVSELYTFGSNRADVFSIKGSVVGAEGASGGPVLDVQGNVIGMIVTRGDDTVDGTGSLRAITLSHVAQTITEETGFSLAQNLGGNLEDRATAFTDTMTPFLLDLLTSAPDAEPAS